MVRPFQNTFPIIDAVFPETMIFLSLSKLFQALV
jgi:hypothetical protein